MFPRDGIFLPLRATRKDLRDSVLRLLSETTGRRARRRAAGFDYRAAAPVRFA